MRSIRKNFEELKLFLASIDFSFYAICITETWEDSSSPLNQDSYFDLPSYNLISQARTGKRGGGVAIFIKKNY